MQPGNRSSLRDDPHHQSRSSVIDRGSDFLVGAAHGVIVPPAYDEALDRMAAFLTDGYYYYQGSWAQPKSQ